MNVRRTCPPRHSAYSTPRPAPGPALGKEAPGLLFRGDIAVRRRSRPKDLDDRVGGRAWWKLDLSDFVDPTQPGSLPDLSQEAPRGLVDARIRVLAFLDELEQQRGIRSGRVILGGFSQGAAVALDVALHDRRQLRGLALLSGTIVNERDWFARLSSRRGLPVFIAHSPEDTVLPYRLAQRLRLALEAEGWLVTWRPFEGGHALPAQVVEGLGAFAQALSAPPSLLARRRTVVPLGAGLAPR